MSALPPKADIGGHDSNVRYGPEADVGLSSTLRFQADRGDNTFESR